MEYSQQVDRYVFRKPLWRKLFPPFVIAFVWLLPAFLLKGESITLPEPFNTWPITAMEWLDRFGITLSLTTTIAAILTAFIVYWWYRSFEVLIISADAITRSSLLGFRNTLRWVEVDEVLIDHLEARMEGDATARKTLYLYEIPKGIFGLRRCMKINNRQFDGFEDVERIAVLVSVPAVAERLRQKVEHTRKPITFKLQQPGEMLIGLLAIALGLLVVASAFYEPFWEIVQIPEYLWIAQPATIVFGVFIFLFGIAKMIYKQIGVDTENIYFMRRGWILKKVPIDNIADIQIRDNQMRIYAFVKDPEIPRQVFKTNEYIRNRGVLLRLIREIYDLRRIMDNEPIAGVNSSTFNG